MDSIIEMLAKLIIAKKLITGMNNQGEPFDFVYVDFPKPFDSVCPRLLITKIAARRLS